MFFWILFVIFALIFVVCAIGAIATREAGAVGAAVIAALVLGVIVVAFSATTVSARSVGIQTSFGKYQDTLSNGFHFTAPWSSVEEFSTQVQDLDLEVPVSFDGGSSGTATLTTLWAIEGEDAQELWKDWKNFERVRDRLVEPAARTSVAAEFSNYAPEAAKDGNNRVAIQDSVLETLKADLVDNGVDVRSIQLTDVKLGERAQNSVDRIAEAASNTERATEEQERAKIEAETAKIRQESQTPEALQRYCLEVVNGWNVGQNGNLPATFNCVLDAGSQTPVIIGN